MTFSTTLTISVSRREADRPRLLQLVAFDGRGERLEGLTVILTVDDDGTFHAEAPLRSRELVTGSHGIALAQWYEWPRNGPARDFTSTVTATWQHPTAAVFLEDLYE